MNFIKDKIPSFSINNERIVNNAEFLQRCQFTITSILRDIDDIKIKKYIVTSNHEFGFIFRADFDSPDMKEMSINRIMLWQLPDGEIAEAMGFDITDIPI